MKASNQPSEITACKPTSSIDSIACYSIVDLGKLEAVELKGNAMTQPFGTNHHQIILIHVEEGVFCVKIGKISHLTSSGAYTSIHMADFREPLYVAKNIGRFEELLVGHGFHRIHKTAMVNMLQIKSYSPVKNGGIITMESGETLKLARGRRAEFTRMFNLLATLRI